MLINFKKDNVLSEDITKTKLDHYSQNEGLFLKIAPSFISSTKKRNKKATFYELNFKYYCF